MSLVGHKCSFLLGIHLGVELPGHKIDKCLALVTAAWGFSREAAPVYAPTCNSSEFWMLSGFLEYHR